MIIALTILFSFYCIHFIANSYGCALIATFIMVPIIIAFVKKAVNH